ncbi:MAG: DUF6398 domain-containing protein [Deltaproteobacteria bacterium]|nr:DUF6398 domain-containing protein [Deltaproteobacteria bacterium]
MSVPKSMQPIYDELEPMLTQFCLDHLNEEFVPLALHLCEKLCRKRPSPLARGGLQGWACAIIHALGSVNFMFDKAQTYFYPAKDLADYFDVSVSTGSTKSKQIRDMFNMLPFSLEWTIPSNFEKIPFFLPLSLLY